MAVLVAIALSGAGAIVYAIQANQLHDTVVAGIDGELNEFVGYSQGRPAGTTLRQTVLGFIRSHVPDDCAVQISVTGGREKYVGGADVSKAEADDMLADPEVTRLIAQVGRTGQSARYDAPDYGPLLIAGQPVIVQGQTGALVVISYLQKDGADLSNTMRTYLLVALLSLLLITALAAWQSGRLLAPLRTLRRTADEIQVYITDPVATVTRPVLELKAFARVHVEAGGARQLEFRIPVGQLGFYDAHLAYVVEPGSMEVLVGTSSRDVRQAGSFSVIPDPSRPVEKHFQGRWEVVQEPLAVD